MQVKSYWESFVSILFPPLCVSCENVLLHQEEFICTTCRYHLPTNDHYHFKQNEVTQRLLGKAPIYTGAAYLSFSKSSLVQAIIHKLKYRKDLRIGKYLGKCFGKQLLASTFYSDIDVVVPLPLHRKKKRIRGYNQSEYIAQGIADVMSLPLNQVDFVRIINTETQTKKSRVERHDNVEDAFFCIKPSVFESKHILLVDDVFTTGATIASAARALAEQCHCKVSIAVLAIA
ncbi:ComF family protein [Sphingobacterium phlebotomi]|nr:phosphoribosyltransferase family protein [Sphingobacterium phlebotomi]